MLVILTDRQILSVEKVCSGCLMADCHGLPRWRKGKLDCGHLIKKSDPKQGQIYKCQMGFQLTNV